MATKKLVKKEAEITSSSESIDSNKVLTEILLELKRQTEYMDRLDWKFWKLQTMLELVAADNGYVFEVNEDGITFNEE